MFTLASLAILTAVPLLVRADSETSLPHLFDPLIPTKLAATYALQSSPPSQFPEYTTRDNGSWLFFGLPTWTDGFFPVTLYAMHERATLCPRLGLNADTWLDMGRASSTGELPLNSFPQTSLDHDVGFLSFPFMEELRVNPSNATAQDTIKNLAAVLAARFNPLVGCTRSWNTADLTDFQVIIDNMMNLELLFASDALAHNQTLIDIAISHADRTAQEHVRSDGSTFHVVEYNSTTGDVIRKRTAQGFADNSTWTRGQSWAIYGYANMHKHTRLQRFLDTARHVASYWLSHTPSTGVIPWDFNAPTDPFIADTSAAMIAANGFLLLAEQEFSVGNTTGASLYYDAARTLIDVHAGQFWKPEWQSLLSNGTVNAPELNNLTGIVYGDYYFVRAGNELVKQGLATC